MVKHGETKVPHENGWPGNLTPLYLAPKFPGQY